MAAPMTTGLRRVLAAALIVALTLAGLGRAIAAVDAAFPGLSAPICHSGAGEASPDPDQPGRHDCCDDCALLAPAVLPSPPVVAAPAPAAHHAAPARALHWAPTLARPRGPRLSRGPPVA